MKGIQHHSDASTLADILERVLDKGIVIAGDIRINIAEIELISIRIRLLISSVDKAKEMGITWWEQDSFLNAAQGNNISLSEENQNLQERVQFLEKQLLALNNGKKGE